MHNNTYYGYKLYAVYTTDVIFTNSDLTQASVHNIHYLKDIKHVYQNCILLEDKYYLSIGYQRNLFTYHQINIEVLLRKNQHGYNAPYHIFRKSRRCIETLFLKLCD